MLVGKALIWKAIKIFSIIIKVMFNDYIVNGTEYKWIITKKTILDSLGMGNIWLSQTFTSVNCLSQHIKQRQYDQYLQKVNVLT